MRAKPLLIALFGLVLVAAPAWAGDLPDYDAESLIFIQDDLPSGWDVLDSDDDLPDGLPTEDALTELGGDAVESMDLMVEYRLIGRKDGAQAVVAIVDVDTEGGPDAYRSALESAASASGWTMTDLGHPARVLIVAGQPADVQALTTWHVELSAKMLCDMAYERILKDHSYGKPGRISRERASEYIEAAEKLSPGIGGAVVMSGLFKLYDENFEDAYATLAKGTKGGAAIEAPKGLVVFALTMQGRSMLERKRADLDEESIDVFERAIALQQVAFDEALRLEKDSLRSLAFENRYNLACAYSRLTKADDAFRELEGAFKLAKMILMTDHYLGNFRRMWFWDEDFDGLRSDPRFEKFCKEYAPKDFDFEEERKKAEEEKKKRDADKPDGSTPDPEKEKGDGDGDKADDEEDKDEG